jgi:hypothetical protein
MLKLTSILVGGYEGGGVSGRSSKCVFLVEAFSSSLQNNGIRVISMGLL